MLLLCLITGCEEARPIRGGTSGILHAGTVPLGDIQVTVFRTDSDTNAGIGFAVTKADGRFELLHRDAAGPLHLDPGRYRVAVESVGPVPMKFPPEYQSGEKSPLVIDWNPERQRIDLDVPLPSSGP